MEILSSLFESFKNRLTNKFIGNFIITYSIYNYKIILILFSSEKIMLKINYITFYLSNNCWLKVWFLPFGISILMSIVTPFISYFIEFCNDYPNTERIKLRNEYLKNTSESNTLEMKNQFSNEADKLQLELESEKIKIEKERIELFKQKFIDDIKVTKFIKKIQKPPTVRMNFVSFTNSDLFVYLINSDSLNELYESVINVGRKETFTFENFIEFIGEDFINLLNEYRTNLKLDKL
jgi:hypothetical protein